MSYTNNKLILCLIISITIWSSFSSELSPKTFRNTIFNEYKLLSKLNGLLQGNSLDLV